MSGEGRTEAVTKIMTVRDALRIVSIDAARLLTMLGLPDQPKTDAVDDALAARGYAMIPLLRDGETIDRGSVVRLLALTDSEQPTESPHRARRMVAILESAIEIAAAMGPLDDAMRGRVLHMIDAVGVPDAVTRSILGAHFVHYAEFGAPREARPLALSAMDAGERGRIVQALFSIARGDGVLYDVSVEAMERILDRGGVAPLMLQGWLIGPRDRIVIFSRPEMPPDSWPGLEASSARLLSWIAARPRVAMADVRVKAHSMGLDPGQALGSIEDWSRNRLGTGMISRSRMPSIEDRSKSSGVD